MRCFHPRAAVRGGPAAPASAAVDEGSRGRYNWNRPRDHQLLRGDHGGPGRASDREHRGIANDSLCRRVSGLCIVF